MKNRYLHAACCTALAFFARSGFSMQTDNHGIHAVPPPGPVTIDGKLDDWDLSGQTLMCYDVESLKDIYSVRVAMMHDTENLYIAIHWKDPIPMGNTHDPHFQAGRGWAGDSVQLRMKTDKICHLTAWYYAKEEEPFVNIEYGKSLTEPFGGGAKNLWRTKDWKLDDGAEMAYLKDADGKGYVQEMKLPWKLISEKGTYSAGETIRCGFELLWGEADWPVHRYADNLADGATSREFFWTAKDAWGEVKLEPKGKLTLPTPIWEQAQTEEKPEGSIEIKYELPKDSRVTLAINDADGKRVRNLIAALPRKKGANTELWDGLDDQGNLVKTGSYSVKGIYHDSLSLTYSNSFASPGKPGWGTADGKGGFYGDHTSPQAVAAGPGNFLALACPMGEAGAHLIGVDMTGQRQWGLANRNAFGGGRVSLATDGKILWVANGDASKNGTFTVWRCDLKTGKYAPWSRKTDDGKPVLDLLITATDATANCRAIALNKDKLAVLVAKEKRILLLDAEKGDILKEIKDAPEGMMACAYTPEGILMVVAGSEVYAVNTESGAIEKKIEGLDEPRGIACAANGEVYVSQRGKKMNVEVFDAAGKKVAEIGKPGGRPASGFYDPNGMYLPAQIALDSQGRLWVTEEYHYPKRTSVWTRDGKLALDLPGTTGYAAGGLVNAFDHTRGFSERTEYQIDNAKQSYKPLYTLPDAIGTGFESICKVAKVNGHEYAQAHSSAHGAGMVKLFMRTNDGAWKHVAEWGNVGSGKSIDDGSARGYNQPFHAPAFEGSFGKAFLWIDKNLDGVVQKEEVEFSPVRFGRYYWGQVMGDDLTVAEPLAGKESSILVFKPESFTAEGVPVFSFKQTQTVKAEMSGEGQMSVGRNGKLYFNQTPLSGMDATGKTLWTYPSEYVSVHGSHRAPAAAPGILIGPSSFYGTALVNDEVGEVFYLNGNLGQNFIFTEDGLWVQSLFNDCRGWFDIPLQATPGMPCDAMTAGGESFGGGFCKGEDGKYYVVGGGTAALVFELGGMDTLKRINASAQVTEKDLESARDLKVKYAARKMAPKDYTASLTDKPIPADGNLTNWGMDKNTLEIATSRQKIGLVKVAYDEKNLYLGYKVNDESPLKNTGQNEQLMFKTGDCVDLMLRADPTVKESGASRSDLRLLMTQKDGKPLAVLYEASVPGTKPDARVGFSSPARTVYFDRVRVVDFPLAFKPVPGGYAVTAAIPFALLGVDAPKGKSFKTDFGILGSDSAGRECKSRNYWSNKTTNNTNDIPDEAVLQPALWGTLKFE